MPDWLVPLAQVLFIDLVLAGDNAIVVGMAAAGLPPEQRRKAIFWGIIAATVMRIGFAAITTQLLAIVGITLAGGVLLLWVCWKMFRELRDGGGDAHGAHHDGDSAEAPAMGRGKTLTQAITQILVADVSMSLDNVLAVAGAAKHHLWVLVFGLGISVVLMGVAATLIANLLNRHRWIAWVGLLVILYVAVEMIFSGTHEVAERVPGAYAHLLLPLGYLALPDVFPAWLWALATVLQVVFLTMVVMGTAQAMRRVGVRPSAADHEPKVTNSLERPEFHRAAASP
jgi:YjbE family integral membrane protein